LTGTTEKLAVIHNLSSGSIDVPVPVGAILLSGNKVIAENKLSLGAYSSALLKI
jgi:hypothetical protein